MAYPNEALPRGRVRIPISVKEPASHAKNNTYDNQNPNNWRKVRVGSIAGDICKPSNQINILSYSDCCCRKLIEPSTRTADESASSQGFKDASVVVVVEGNLKIEIEMYKKRSVKVRVCKRTLCTSGLMLWYLFPLMAQLGAIALLRCMLSSCRQTAYRNLWPANPVGADLCRRSIVRFAGTKRTRTRCCSLRKIRTTTNSRKWAGPRSRLTSCWRRRPFSCQPCDTRKSFSCARLKKK